MNLAGALGLIKKVKSSWLNKQEDIAPCLACRPLLPDVAQFACVFMIACTTPWWRKSC